MNKEEILEKIKEKVDTLSVRANELLKNKEKKFTKEDFMMYSSVHSLFNDLDKLIERKSDTYIDYTMKYLNCMSCFQDHKIKEFVDVSNETRPMLDSPDFLTEKEKLLMDYIALPSPYSEAPNLPNLPEGAKAYSSQLSNSVSVTYTKREIGMDEMLPYGNIEGIYNVVASKNIKDSKILGAGFGETTKNKYKCTYFIIGIIPQNPYSLILQTTFQFEIEGKLLELNASVFDMMSNRIVDIKTKPENKDITNDTLLEMITNEELDKTYPDDGICKFRKIFKELVENN